MGASEKNIRAVFELAQKYDRSIIFFDEIDALGSQRSSSQDLHEKTLINELLSQMDGIERKMKHRQCLILAATNRPWDIDLALRRPGRFDTAIFIPHPDFDARKKLFEISFRNKPAQVDIELLAGMTHWIYQCGNCKHLSKCCKNSPTRTNTRIKEAQTNLK